MDRLFQVLAGALLTVILGITLSKQNKDMTLMLTLAVCCMVFAVAVAFLEPVVNFVDQLENVAQLDSDMVQIILKCVGVSLVAEIAGMICSDAGFGSLAKAIQILAAAAVLWLSLPLMSALLDMLQTILGET